VTVYRIIQAQQIKRFLWTWNGGKYVYSRYLFLAPVDGSSYQSRNTNVVPQIYTKLATVAKLPYYFPTLTD